MCVCVCFDVPGYALLCLRYSYWNFICKKNLRTRINVKVWFTCSSGSLSKLPSLLLLEKEELE